MAILGLYNPLARLHSIFGDNLDNEIEISRDTAGRILVNKGTVPTQGGAPTVAATSLVQVFGQAGDDIITLNEMNGALPRANIFGGAGNDRITGGNGSDQLFGQTGNDVLDGKAGNDLLFGGDGNDILIGGSGDDQMFGEAGDDLMIWNPGDGNDLMEGGAGFDTAEVNGGNGSEQFTVTANGTRVRFDRIDPAPFSLDIGTTERLVVNMGGGNDTFSATGNLAALISITVDGGDGNDTILGSNGADLLIGGGGDDFIDGNQGNDTILMGAGFDSFRWDPGDGSDSVDGGDDFDRMIFNGSAAGEIMTLSPNGSRAMFTRSVGNIVMDLTSVERIEVNALGGSDTIIINDTTGTDTSEVIVRLAATLGGTAGDGQVDVVIVNGSSAADFVELLAAGTEAALIGLHPFVSISGLDAANDSLVVNLLGGDDSFDASGVAAGIVKLTIDGGDGNDTLLGSQGADTFLGGDGDDVILGDGGDDIALMGAGDDLFQWSPGDGNDIIEGQAGTDTLRFFGSNASESIDIVANGGRVLFLRNVGNVTMDLTGIEVIDLRALGGADNIVVGDLSGTDTTTVRIDLSGVNGGGDGAADTVTVTGTQGADVFGVTGNAAGVHVFGLKAGVELLGAEIASDRLVLNGLGGDDVIDARDLEAGVIQLSINGGLGADVLLGSQGNDLIIGSDGNDLALMGAGNDVFVWNPGDDNDTLEGQAGFDELLFNGANVAETIDIFANGGRALLFRNVASVLMDMNDVEKITFNALGGADTVVVHDLSGTDVVEVGVNLAAAGGADDGQPDTVIVNGTSDDDVIVVVSDGSGLVRVLGLSAEVLIFNFGANDRLVINGLGGDDVIEASGLLVGLLLTADGGDGNDVLIGGDGNDVLLGGAGDDVLIGGPGIDVLDGGTGNNILIQ